jgi:DmsE family decaheme c-type cytochrome
MMDVMTRHDSGHSLTARAKAILGHQESCFKTYRLGVSMKRREAWWALCGLVGIILFSLAVAAGPAQGQSKDSSQEKAAAAPSQNSGYAGAEACKTCHEEIYNGWERTPHWKTMLNTKGGPSHQGCEGCHGPAANHVADPSDTSGLFRFEKATAKEVNDRCLTCHASGSKQMHAINSVHARNDVSCTSCHSPHHAVEKEHLLIKTQPELCYTCHLQQKAQFDMPFHHRVNEGLVQCTDCHNPHGTIKPKQVQTSSTQNAICFKCHTDKQGPFVYEHAPVKIDGCQACHLTHGGPNPHMLKLSNVNLLCLQCHTTSSFSTAPGAPSFHNQASFFQSCVLCHSQIHGSNFDATLFK